MLRRRRPAWGVRRRQDISEPDSTDVFRVSGRVPWHVLPDSRDAQGLRRCHPEVLFDSRTRRRRQDGSQAIAQHGVTSQTAPTPLRDIAAKSTASLSRNRRQHEQESTEKSSTQGKKDGALHGLHGRLGGLPVGHGIPCQTACGCPAAPIPLRWATSHVARPGPTMKKQNSHQKPKRRKRKRRLVNNQRRAQKNLTPDCSGHVAQANESMSRFQRTTARPQGKKETPGHSNCPASVNRLCTLSGPQAPEQGKHVPEVGLEPGSRP